MRLGIFVGSFNPVHKAHINIAKYILKKDYVDKVLIIPTPNYWDKTDLVDTNHRINMLKFYESDNIVIETELINHVYTYDLMIELKKKYKNDELYLIIGADNIVSFDKWKNYEELLKLNFIIYTRNDIDVKYYLDKLNKKDKYILLDKVPSFDVSSSKIREMILNKEPVNDYLDKKVIKYIERNNLYGN